MKNYHNNYYFAFGGTNNIFVNYTYFRKEIDMVSFCDFYELEVR